jgi:inactivated superfamily I helicase
MRQAVRREDLSDGLRLEFSASGDTLALITRAVEAERQCCRFIRFGITVEADGGPDFLDLTGAAGTRDFISALFEDDE